jgi:hypothetical protein
MQPLPTVPQNCRQTLVFKVGPTAAEHTVHFHSVLHHRKWVVIHLKVNAASILWIVKLPFPRVRLLTIEEFYFRFELSFSFSSSLSVKFILSWFYSSAFLIFLCVMTGADICTDVTKKKLFSKPKNIIKLPRVNCVNILRRCECDHYFFIMTTTRQNLTPLCCICNFDCICKFDRLNR